MKDKKTTKKQTETFEGDKKSTKINLLKEILRNYKSSWKSKHKKECLIHLEPK
jgi:hypothetical protein